MLLVRKLGFLQLVFEGDDRVGLAPAFLVLGRPVFVWVDDGVAFEAVAEGLDEARLGVCACLLNDLACLEENLAHVHAVDLDRLHVVGASLLVDFRDCRGGLDRSPHAVPVVDAEPDHRQIENFGEVQRLVECADVRGAVAEHAEDDVLLLFVADCPAAAGREREVSADDAVTAHEAQIRVEHVHRASAAVRRACLLSEQLGHDRFGVDAARDRVPVFAVAGEDVVRQLERNDAADHRRLFADVEVTVAADLRLRVLLLGALLEAPDELHLTVQAEEEVAIVLCELEALGRDLGGAWGSGWRLYRGDHLLLTILNGCGIRCGRNRRWRWRSGSRRSRDRRSRALVRDVDSSALSSQRCLHERLRQGRVRVDRQVELFHGETVLNHQGRFRYQVCRTRPDDVRAQQFARARVGDDLDEALRLPESQRPA